MNFLFITKMNPRLTVLCSSDSHSYCFSETEKPSSLTWKSIKKSDFDGGRGFIMYLMIFSTFGGPWKYNKHICVWPTGWQPMKTLKNQKKKNWKKITMVLKRVDRHKYNNILFSIFVWCFTRSHTSPRELPDRDIGKNKSLTCPTLDQYLPVDRKIYRIHYMRNDSPAA